MVKTTKEYKANKCVVTNRLTYPESINEREYKAIADGFIEGLIPVHAEKSKTDAVLKSTAVGMVSLKSYLGNVVSKNMFLDVIIQIISIVKECEKNLMNPHNLLLDCEYIFLDPHTKKIECIFLPIIDNQNQHSWSEFFNDLPFHAVFTKGENHDYVTRYLHYFKNNPSPTITSFERLIVAIKDNKPYKGSTDLGDQQHLISTVLEESKGNTVGTITNNHEFRSGKPKHCPKCGNIYAERTKYCSACGSPVNGEEPSQIKYLNISEVLGIKVKQRADETTVLGAEEYDDGGTTVLGADTFEEPTIPHLIREKTQEKIFVNKPSFHIGKEQTYCDYVIPENNAVSRRHAYIITRDQRYYVADNDSTNKTYVNNRAIPANKEIEIFSGTKLKFANEEFVFYIE